MTKVIRNVSIYFTLILMFIGMFASAQTNTLIMGKIKNKNPLIKEIELQINMRYISNNVEVYTSNILEDGSFAFAVEVIQPQYANLSYSRNKGSIYLEANDTLYIDFDANSFPFSMEFSGRGGANNTYLYEYLEEHPLELDAFKMVQYRKGIYWYTNNPLMDKMMHSTPKEAFKKKMLLRKQKAFTNLDFYVENNPEKLTPDFKEFLSTEIIYDWAYHMLLYGHIFKGKHLVDETFFTFLDEVPLSNNFIGNYRYREFLMAILNYKHLLTGDEKIPYATQYDMASNLLSDKALAFAQSEMVFRAFLSGNVDEMMARFWDFIDHTQYLEFEEKVNSAYQKARRYSEGSPAPDFNLFDQNKEEAVSYTHLTLPTKA